MGRHVIQVRPTQVSAYDFFILSFGIEILGDLIAVGSQLPHNGEKVTLQQKQTR